MRREAAGLCGVGSVHAWAEERIEAEWQLARARATNYAPLREQTDAEAKLILRMLMRGIAGLAADIDSQVEIAATAGMSLERVVALAREVAVELGWQPAREAIPARLRTLVYRRDGYACVLCGADDVQRLTIDHRIAVDLGGTNEPSNLRTLCRSCNSAKGARL